LIQSDCNWQQGEVKRFFEKPKPRMPLNIFTRYIFIQFEKSISGKKMLALVAVYFELLVSEENCINQIKSLNF